MGQSPGGTAGRPWRRTGGIQSADGVEKQKMADESDVTQLLSEARLGDKDALDRLFRCVYGELRRLAHSRRREWRGEETLNTTALVHEAYLKLVGRQAPHWESRGQFFASASRAMRQILINYAEMRRAAKRGGGKPHVSLDDIPIASDQAADELLVLDRALDQLEALNPRQARVVECRFFAGLSVADTADALTISPATVKRDWAVASAWLHDQVRATSGH